MNTILIWNSHRMFLGSALKNVTYRTSELNVTSMRAYIVNQQKSHHDNAAVLSFLAPYNTLTPSSSSAQPKWCLLGQPLSSSNPLV
jgi:hypothetical protein